MPHGRRKADNAVWADALYTETVADFDEGSDDCYANSSDPANECEWATSPSPSPSANPQWLAPGDQSPSDSDAQGLDPCLQDAATAASFGCVEKALTATAGIAAFGASCANFFGKYANTVWAAARAAGFAGFSGADSDADGFDAGGFSAPLSGSISVLI
jgi:hypothetical protein